MPNLCKTAIHPEGNAIHGLVEGTISPEMERSVRGVSLLRATKACHEVEKHLLSPSAVEALLDGVVSEGVLYFCTPLGRTLTRTL